MWSSIAKTVPKTVSIETKLTDCRVNLCVSDGKHSFSVCKPTFILFKHTPTEQSVREWLNVNDAFQIRISRQSSERVSAKCLAVYKIVLTIVGESMVLYNSLTRNPICVFPRSFTTDQVKEYVTYFDLFEDFDMEPWSHSPDCLLLESMGSNALIRSN